MTLVDELARHWWIRWLLDNQFVDEITLFVCPVVIG